VTENDMITRMDQRKRGRPSKGQRTVLAGRVPIPTKDDAHRRAAELGMTLNDYLAWLIERDVAAHHRMIGKGSNISAALRRE